jgi:CSLREA domain-containing protein
MKRYIYILSCLGMACLPLCLNVWAWANQSPLAQQTAASVEVSRPIVVQAAGRGNPFLNLQDGIELQEDHGGNTINQQPLPQEARSLALASADFDEDGVPDLIIGYGLADGGRLRLYRGNVDSIYSNSVEAQQRKANGTFTDAAFLSPARLSELAQSPDFLAAGDFDADGHWDVATAAFGSRAFYVLPGDGKGNFGAVRRIDLPGAVTAFASGEINRPDGLTDIVIGTISEDGAKALVYEHPEGAMQGKPEVFPLDRAVTTLALSQIDHHYEMDLVIAAGNELQIIHGRDRRLSLDAITQSKVLPPTIASHLFAFEIKSIATGAFTGKQRSEIALLSTDGTVYLFDGHQTQAGQNKVSKQGGTEASKIQAISKWESASGLLGVRVSSGSADDLLVLDKTARKLHVLMSEVSAIAPNSSTLSSRTCASLDVEGEPLAALPMRLNGDALSDLVILQDSSIAPVIVKTAAAMTFTVNKTDDHDDGVCNSGDCTLREAINAANTHSGADTIAFNIAGAGVHTLTFTSSLPTITDPVNIDGATQPGFAGIPIIELSGTGAGTQVNGLTISSGSSTIRKLVINRFFGNTAGNGIKLITNGNNFVEGNYIGTNASGTAIASNESDGVLIEDSSNNRVGGTVPDARNIISANLRIGVEIKVSNGNLVQGNFLGTDVTGTMDLGNFFDGVFIAGLPISNTVGGTIAGARNLISGNDSAGIKFLGGSNLAQGNFIGTTVTGTARLPNFRGVDLGSASNNLIGGTTVAARNIISGNDQEGIAISGGDAVGNRIEGNFIGTIFDGTSSLSNTHFGIIINSGSENVIGGLSNGAGNLIAFNIFGGIAISGGLGIPHDNSILGNTISANIGNGITAYDGREDIISRNSIFVNEGIGIDLVSFPSGITANDVCDVDGGPNDLQNFPVLTSATSNGITTTIQGTLNSTANTTFTLEFFANDSCDPSGFGEGQTFIGSAMVTTNGNCNASFNITLPVAVHAGQTITATAIDPAGNTSEFSQCAAVSQESSFTHCLQDDSNGSLLLINSTTGAYLFTNCQGLVLSGTGTITRTGCAIILQHNLAERRLVAKLDICTKKGTASIQRIPQRQTLMIIDRNTADNTCICAVAGAAAK